MALEADLIHCVEQREPVIGQKLLMLISSQPNADSKTDPGHRAPGLTYQPGFCA